MISRCARQIYCILQQCEINCVGSIKNLLTPNKYETLRDANFMYFGCEQVHQSTGILFIEQLVDTIIKHRQRELKKKRNTFNTYQCGLAANLPLFIQRRNYAPYRSSDKLNFYQNYGLTLINRKSHSKCFLAVKKSVRKYSRNSLKSRGDNRIKKIHGSTTVNSQNHYNETNYGYSDFDCSKYRRKSKSKSLSYLQESRPVIIKNTSSLKKLQSRYDVTKKIPRKYLLALKYGRKHLSDESLLHRPTKVYDNSLMKIDYGKMCLVSEKNRRLDGNRKIVRKNWHKISTSYDCLPCQKKLLTNSCPLILSKNKYDGIVVGFNYGSKCLIHCPSRIDKELKLVYQDLPAVLRKNNRISYSTKRVRYAPPLITPSKIYDDTTIKFDYGKKCIKPCTVPRLDKVKNVRVSRKYLPRIFTSRDCVPCERKPLTGSCPLVLPKRRFDDLGLGYNYGSKCLIDIPPRLDAGLKLVHKSLPAVLKRNDRVCYPPKIIKDAPPLLTLIKKYDDMSIKFDYGKKCIKPCTVPRLDKVKNLRISRKYLPRMFTSHDCIPCERKPLTGSCPLMIPKRRFDDLGLGYNYGSKCLIDIPPRLDTGLKLVHKSLPAILKRNDRVCYPPKIIKDAPPLLTLIKKYDDMSIKFDYGKKCIEPCSIPRLDKIKNLKVTRKYLPRIFTNECFPCEPNPLHDNYSRFEDIGLDYHHNSKFNSQNARLKPSRIPRLDDKSYVYKKLPSRMDAAISKYKKNNLKKICKPVSDAYYKRYDDIKVPCDNLCPHNKWHPRLDVPVFFPNENSKISHSISMRRDCEANSINKVVDDYCDTKSLQRAKRRKSSFTQIQDYSKSSKYNVNNYRNMKRCKTLYDDVEVPIDNVYPRERIHPNPAVKKYLSCERAKIDLALAIRYDCDFNTSPEIINTYFDTNVCNNDRVNYAILAEKYGHIPRMDKRLKSYRKKKSKTFKSTYDLPGENRELCNKKSMNKFCKKITDVYYKRYDDIKTPRDNLCPYNKMHPRLEKWIYHSSDKSKIDHTLAMRRDCETDSPNEVLDIPIDIAVTKNRKGSNQYLYTSSDVRNILESSKKKFDDIVKNINYETMATEASRIPKIDEALKVYREKITKSNQYPMKNVEVDKKKNTCYKRYDDIKTPRDNLCPNIKWHPRLESQKYLSCERSKIDHVLAMRHDCEPNCPPKIMDSVTTTKQSDHTMYLLPQVHESYPEESPIERYDSTFEHPSSEDILVERSNVPQYDNTFKINMKEKSKIVESSRAKEKVNIPRSSRQYSTQNIDTGDKMTMKKTCEKVTDVYYKRYDDVRVPRDNLCPYKKMHPRLEKWIYLSCERAKIDRDLAMRRDCQIDCKPKMMHTYSNIDQLKCLSTPVNDTYPEESPIQSYKNTGGKNKSIEYSNMKTLKYSPKSKTRMFKSSYQQIIKSKDTDNKKHTKKTCKKVSDVYYKRYDDVKVPRDNLCPNKKMYPRHEVQKYISCERAKIDHVLAMRDDCEIDCSKMMDTANDVEQSDCINYSPTLLNEESTMKNYDDTVIEADYKKLSRKPSRIPKLDKTLKLVRKRLPKMYKSDYQHTDKSKNAGYLRSSSKSSDIYFKRYDDVKVPVDNLCPSHKMHPRFAKKVYHSCEKSKMHHELLKRSDCRKNSVNEIHTSTYADSNLSNFSNASTFKDTFKIQKIAANFNNIKLNLDEDHSRIL